MCIQHGAQHYYPTVHKKEEFVTECGVPVIIMDDAQTKSRLEDSDTVVGQKNNAGSSSISMPVDRVTPEDTNTNMTHEEYTSIVGAIEKLEDQIVGLQKLIKKASTPQKIEKMEQSNQCYN